jgi:hypothetical protein
MRYVTLLAAARELHARQHCRTNAQPDADLLVCAYAV